MFSTEYLEMYSTKWCQVIFCFLWQAIGQVLYLHPYVDDFNTQWVLTSVTLLTLGSVFTTYIGERISDLKLGNGTSLLIFTSIISYLPASFGRTAAEAFQDGNYVGLGTIIFSFFLLVLGIVYVQVIVNQFFDKTWFCWRNKILMNSTTKDFRRQKERFHSTMPQDIPAEVVGFKNLLIYPLRFVFYALVSCILNSMNLKSLIWLIPIQNALLVNFLICTFIFN